MRLFVALQPRDARTWCMRLGGPAWRATLGGDRMPSVLTFPLSARFNHYRAPQVYSRSPPSSERKMAGARGCFNCGGCAWCFRVVVVVAITVVSSAAVVCSPFLPPILSASNFPRWPAVSWICMTDSFFSYLHPPISYSQVFFFLFFLLIFSSHVCGAVLTETAFFFALHTRRYPSIRHAHRCACTNKLIQLAIYRVVGCRLSSFLCLRCARMRRSLSCVVVFSSLCETSTV